MKLYEALASALVSENVTDMFGLMGDSNLSLWATIAKRNAPRIYLSRNEAGAVAMADGYFRASGNIGVATVTTGPGLTQCGTSLVAAARNRTPLILLVGEPRSSVRDHIQSIDQKRFAEACEARFVEVRGLNDAAETISEAFHMARVTPGPVVLSIPVDLQNMELKWDWEYVSGLVNPGIPRDAASEASLGRLHDLIRESKRPVIVAGRGAKRSGARAEIIELGDRIGALLATSLQAKGFFYGEAFDVGISGAFANAPAEELLSEADLVIAVGAELGFYTSEGGLLFPEAKIVRIDTTAPKPSISPKGIHLHGDAKKTLQRLNEKLRSEEMKKSGFRSPETLAVINEPREPKPLAADGIDPRAMASALSKCLPQDSMIVTGQGHFVSFVAMYMALPPQADILFSSQFGAVGQTLPVGFGVGMADRNRPLVIIEGDGSVMMNIQELEAIARHGRQTIVVIWNDSGFGAEVHRLKEKGFGTEIASWRSPDFSTVAKGFGGDGVRIEKIDDLPAAFRKGLEKGGLFLIDARISPSEMSDPMGKVRFGVPNTAPVLRYAES